MISMFFFDFLVMCLLFVVISMIICFRLQRQADVV